MATKQKNPISRLYQLSARVDGQLRQFDDDDEADAPNRRLAPEDYVGSRSERKKKKQVVRAGLAGAAVAGGVAAAANRGKLKAGYGAAKESLTNRAGNIGTSAAATGKRAAFRGMDKVGDGLVKGSQIAKGAGALKIGEVLAKGAKKVRKGSLRFFAHRLGDLAERMVNLGA